MAQIHFIPPSLIQVSPDRQRKEFDEGELQTLVASIQSTGLLHPLILRQVPGEENFVLVAGERRFRAIQDIYSLDGLFSCGGDTVPFGLIPYLSLGELSPLEAMEAEYEENIRRVNLSWQEQAKATESLQALRTLQASVKGLPPPTVSEIAQESRPTLSKPSAHDATRKELAVARNLSNPKIAEAKTVDEAFKILKKEENNARLSTLSETVGKTFTADSHSLFHTDALEWLGGCPEQTFDIILTDPPYGMGADSFGNAGTEGGIAYASHTYDDSFENFKSFMDGFLPETFRVTKPDAHLYLFCDPDNFHFLRHALSNLGWKVFRTPLIWYKPQAFRAPWPTQGPQRKYETILYAVKGEKKTIALFGDVITCPSDPNLGHQAQKPVDLFVDLLRRSAIPGDKVLDACCGSGTIFPAATLTRTFATGLEIDPTHYGRALTRLKASLPKGN